MDSWLKNAGKVGINWRANLDHNYSCNEKQFSAMGWLRGKASIPPAFIAVMLRDIADAFDKKPPESENSCECC